MAENKMEDVVYFRKKVDYSKFTKRINILKDIHRKKVIEKMEEKSTVPVERTKLKDIECVICGKVFTPDYVRVKYCKQCRPQRESPVFISRALEWVPILKNKFKNREFTKEEVNECMNYGYSLEIVRRVLRLMILNGDLKLIDGNFRKTHRYQFEESPEVLEM